MQTKTIILTTDEERFFKMIASGTHSFYCCHEKGMELIERKTGNMSIMPHSVVNSLVGNGLLDSEELTLTEDGEELEWQLQQAERSNEC